MMDEQKLDRIDRYLRGEMSDKESLLFEQEALNDEHLRKETELTYSIKRRLADRQSKLRQTNSWRKSRQKNFFQIGGFLTAAAVLAVGIFIWMPSKTSPVDQPQLAHYDVHDVNAATTPLSENKRIAKVEKTVREGRHQEALKEIKEIEEEQALPSINAIIMTERTVDVRMASYTPDDKVMEAYELNWLRIQSMTKVGMAEEAKILLKNFVQINGIHQTAADSLLREIEMK